MKRLLKSAVGSSNTIIRFADGWGTTRFILASEVPDLTHIKNLSTSTRELTINDAIKKMFMGSLAKPEHDKVRKYRDGIGIVRDLHEFVTKWGNVYAPEAQVELIKRLIPDAVVYISENPNLVIFKKDKHYVGVIAPYILSNDTGKFIDDPLQPLAERYKAKR